MISSAGFDSLRRIDAGLQLQKLFAKAMPAE
jgi:hypothetical protein